MIWPTFREVQDFLKTIILHLAKGLILFVGAPAYSTIKDEGCISTNL